MFDILYVDDAALLKEICYAIKVRFPNAEIKDANDEVHRNRFSVEIPGVDIEELWVFSIRENFCFSLFSFQLELYSPTKTLEERKLWLTELKELAFAEK
jgi:hypothetical protein